MSSERESAASFISSTSHCLTRSGHPRNTCRPRAKYESKFTSEEGINLTATPCAHICTHSHMWATSAPTCTHTHMCIRKRVHIHTGHIQLPMHTPAVCTFSFLHICAHTCPSVSHMTGGEKSSDFSLFLKPGQHNGPAAAGADSVFALPVTPLRSGPWISEHTRGWPGKGHSASLAWSGMYKPLSSVTWPLTVPTWEWQHAPLSALSVVAMTDLLMNSS